MKKLIAVILTLAMMLAITLGAAEQAEMTAAAGKTLIGMSREEVSTIMGREPDWQTELKDGAAVDAEYDEVYFAGMKTSVGFVFENDRLVMAGFYGFDGRSVSEIDTVKQAITREFGEPFPIPANAVDTLFEALSGIDTGFTFDNISGWQPDAESVALAFEVSSEYSSQIYVVFVNTDYALQAGIAAGDSEPETKTEPEPGEAEIQGSWKLTDFRSETASGEELAQTKQMIESGMIGMVYAFDSGKVAVTAIVLGQEETETSAYRLEENRIILIHEDETTSEETAEYQINGDTMELKISGSDEVLILTRQQ